MPPTPDWSDFRREMPVAARWAYFDHAAVAPWPQRSAAVMADWARDLAEQGDVGWLAWSHRAEATRRRAAEVLGADAAEIALLPNTTAGIGLVAEGYPWQPGDNVVTLANEFPSNQYPWMNLAARGVATRRVPVEENGRVDLNRLEAACDARTRIVALSWVGFASGWRIDPAEVAALAHRRGALLFLDAIQGLGVFPLDVHQAGVDFAAADGHKWLLGPEGAGIFYIARAHLDRLRPLGVGWNSVGHADYSRIEWQVRPDAARYEGGTLNLGGFAALGASLELLCEFGLRRDHSAVAERVLDLADRAAERLAKVGAVLAERGTRAERSGIVACALPGVDLKQARGRLLQAGVVANVRNARLRISAHAYNDDTDLQRLAEAVQELLQAT